MKSGLVWVLAAGMVAGWAGTGRGEASTELLEGKGMERTANGVLCHGDAAGEWTHDWDAAMAAAKADGGTVFANFTGSDWCGWCRLMDRQVFSTDEWKEWAKESGVHFAWVDFPEDVSLLPDEKTQERNEKLSQKYEVEGFPTYFLLDGEGAVLWQGGASRGATPEAFIGELKSVLETVKRGLAWIDEEEGLEFPKSLGGLPFTGRTDYREDGLGYSLRYGAKDGEGDWADVYVYDAGEEDIGEGATPAAKGQVEETLGITLRRERRGEVSDVKLPQFGYVMKIGGVKYFAAGFQFAMGGQALDSLVAVTGRGTVFVKVRYSRPQGEGFMEAKGMTETVKAFLRELGAVLGAGAE